MNNWLFPKQTSKILLYIEITHCFAFRKHSMTRMFRHLPLDIQVCMSKCITVMCMTVISWESGIECVPELEFNFTNTDTFDVESGSGSGRGWDIACAPTSNPAPTWA